MRTWILYIGMFMAFFFLFDRNQSADDVLNASRPSANYVHSFSYGFKEYDLGQIHKAMAYYKTMLTGKLGTPLMYANLGFCYFVTKNLSKASEYYYQAISKDGNMYAFYYDLGFIKLMQKDLKTAVQLFQRSKLLLPSNAGELEKILHVSPKFTDQPVFYYYMRDRVPRDKLMIYVHLCSIYQALNQDRELYATAAEGIEYFPKDPEFYYYAGIAAKRLGFMKQATMLFSKAIDLAPDFVKAYEERAQLLGSDQVLYAKDLRSIQEAKLKGGWKRVNDITELHHWDDGILLYQIYR